MSMSIKATHLGVYSVRHLYDAMSTGVETSPRGSLEATKVLPRLRLDVLMPRSYLGINVKLRYVITIHNFHPFSICIYVIKTLKTKLHLCIV